jgi:regulator of protease activity HflC (stomatin/prohibitin superfamily)
MKEREVRPWSGAVVLVALLIGEGVLGTVVAQALAYDPAVGIATIVAMSVLALGFAGFFVVDPNEAKVLQFFGNYVGTVKSAGLKWANPLYTKRRVSLRAISQESNRLKVNDHDGNPIEIAAIVVWKVVDTAKAVFQVDRFDQYVQVQCEAALRNLATSYSYDGDGDTRSLRGHTAEIADHLKKEIQERCALAGVEIVESRIAHLAYAPEIAQAMLQRQQANAIIAARQKIVDGAVGMVEMALERLSRNRVVDLDEERKAQMVSNLLVVLCGERATQPVVNAGTIYQ